MEHFILDIDSPLFTCMDKNKSSVNIHLHLCVPEHN